MVETGERLGRAGDPHGAILCFTRAANSVKDEQWLPQPQRLGGAQRRLLSRLYAGASKVLLKQGATAEVQTWLRRAVQIVSPSVEVLFADDSAHPGAAGGLPEDGLQEQARGRCDENVLAQHGKWPEVAQCLKARGIATLEAVGGQGLGRHATEALDPAAWIRLGFACVLAGDAAGGRASVQTAHRLEAKGGSVDAHAPRRAALLEWRRVFAPDGPCAGGEKRQLWSTDLPGRAGGACWRGVEDAFVRAGEGCVG